MGEHPGTRREGSGGGAGHAAVAPQACHSILAPEDSTICLDCLKSAWNILSKSATLMDWGSAPWVWMASRTSGMASSLFTSALTLVTMADRKSTRLNSSHQIISYPVSC